MYIHICIYTHTHICTHIHSPNWVRRVERLFWLREFARSRALYMYIHTYVTHIHIYIHVYMHTTHVHICIYIYMYVYIYTCIYVHTTNSHSPNWVRRVERLFRLREFARGHVLCRKDSISSRLYFILSGRVSGSSVSLAEFCVAVCCSVLQCVVVCCRVLQGVAGCCRVVLCGAVCGSVVQCGAVQLYSILSR